MAKNQKLFWAAIAFGGGVAAVLALIGFAKGSIVAFVILGAVFFTWGAVLLGWMKAPHWLGTPIRIGIFIIVFWGGMIGLGWWVWPNNSRTSPHLPSVHVFAVDVQKLAPDEVVAVRVGVENLGVTDAVNASAFNTIALAKAPLSPEHFRERAIDRLAPRPTTIAPKQRIALHAISPQPVTAEHYRMVLSGELLIYIYGNLLYDDIAGGKHEREFCLSYEPDLKEFAFCGLHNRLVK